MSQPGRQSDAHGLTCLNVAVRFVKLKPTQRLSELPRWLTQEKVFGRHSFAAVELDTR